MVGLPTSLPSSKDGKREREIDLDDDDGDSYELTCRVSRFLSRTLEQIRLPLGYTSVKSVAEELVEENSFEIVHLIKGIEDYIDFVRELEHTLDVGRDFSKFYHEKGQFSMGNLDHTIYMELRMYESGGLKTVEIEADMNKSDVVRASLVKGIYDHIEEGDISLKPSERRRIKDTWYEVRNSFAYYHRRFESLLYVNFVDNINYVEETFDRYPGRANDFARYYKENFVGSDGYERMMKMEVDEPFENMERVINQHTEVTVSNHV